MLQLHVFVVLKPGAQEGAPNNNFLKTHFNKSLGKALGPGYYAEEVLLPAALAGRQNFH
jgi:hypothetical protein